MRYLAGGMGGSLYDESCTFDLAASAVFNRGQLLRSYGAQSNHVRVSAGKDI